VNLKPITAQLLDPTGLDDATLDVLLAQMMQRSVEIGELYFQSVKSESWGLEDGAVKDGVFNSDRGVGVRAISGEKTGFAYANDLSVEAIAAAARAARGIAGSGSGMSVSPRVAARTASLYPDADPVVAVPEQDKIVFLKGLDTYARARDPRVKEVNLRLGASFDTSLVVATDGTLAGDVRPLVRLDVTVIVEASGKRERGFAGGGGRWLMPRVLDESWARGLADEAVRQALVNLDARDAPAGPMPVVLGPGWPGVLLHEAVGHGLEGDFNRRGSSAYAGRIGERVASAQCTVVDDGTLADRRGSLSVDDEGCPTQRTVLIENGVLRGYLQDKMNARLMNTVSTGNGRRQSYAHPPMPRMTNTFMLAGDYAPQDLIASVDRGLFAANFGGGQVDITSGKFVFGTTEAYLIENGRITQPVKGATLIGSGPEVMQRVSMVANDLALDDGVGICGKDGQSVPVGVGQPSLKIDEVTVGGTAT
jgi:TldD protein